MPEVTLFYRTRIRNAANSADDLVVSTLGVGGTNPYMTAPPSGDGGSLDILTGAIQEGALQVRLADAITGANTRILTAILADAAGKQQLLGRVVVIEESTDGTSWATYFIGYLRGVRLVTGIEYELTVGDITRAESSYLCFSQISATFPQGVNIIGEPIPGGWGPIPAIGQTTFVVLDKTAKRVRLQYKYGPLPPDYVYKNSGSRDHFLTVNRLARPFAVQNYNWMGEDPTVRANFPRLAVVVSNPTTGAVVGTFTPIVQPATPIAGDPILQRRILEANSLLSDGLGYLWLDWPAGGAIAQPANGTLYAVRVYPLDVSDLNPVHLEGHPIDIWTSLYTLAGIPYSASAAAALKDALGATLRFRGRITAPILLSDFVAKMFAGPLGIGVRVASDGTRELIAVRDLPTSLPGTTITVNDLRSDQGVIFDLNDSTVVNRVTWKIQQYGPWDPTLDGGQQPNDLISIQPIQYQTINGDSGALVGKEQTYDVMGHFYDSRGATFFSPIDFFAAQASRVFDRFGRGGIESEVQVVRGISPALGSYVVLNVPHLPVAVQGATPVSQRGQAPRAVQVKGSRPDPSGPILRVLDIGRNALPAVNPTLTFAASALDPKHVAEVTVTNAAALSAAGIERVNFQMATGAGTPAGGSVDFAARGVFQLLTTPTVPLPPVAAGEKVWVRAQSKDSQALFAGPWTAWTSVTLTALTAPSGLVLSSGANDTEKVVTWALADLNSPVLIRWKLTGDVNWAASVALPAGTVTYTIRNLVPGGGGITGEVLVMDYSPSPGQSTPTAFSFTPGSTVPTLPTPWSPAGWCGPQDDLSGGPGLADGSFGLDVTAAQWPAFVEFEVAVETGIGTGVYGSFVTASAPLVQQGYRTRTRFSSYAANDKLRRKLRARHNLPGYTASAYTAEVVVNPWVAQKSIIPAIATPSFSLAGKVDGTQESPAAFLLAIYVPPTNPHFDYVRYRVRQRKQGSSTWGPYTYAIGGRDGDDMVPVNFGVEAEVRMEVVNTDGVVDTSATPLVVLTPKLPVAQLLEFDVNVLTGSSVPGPLVRLDYGREPTAIVIAFSPNEYCVRVRVFSEETNLPPAGEFDLNDGRAPFADLAVEPAAYVPGFTFPVGSLYVLRLPLGATPHYRNTTLVPYDRLGRAGTPVIMGSATGDATALPAAPTAASNVSVPAGGSTLPQIVRNSVTPQSGTNFIRCYRNGRFEGDYGPFTAGVPHNIDHVAYSGQVDVWEYVHYTGTPLAPRESLRTTAFTTTTPTLKLATPSGAIFHVVGAGPAFPSPRDVVVDGVGWLSSTNPFKTKAILQRATSGAGPWTDVATLDSFQQGLSYTPGTGTWYFQIIFRLANYTDSASPSVAGPFPYP